MQVSGAPGNIMTTLTSDPPLSEPDIMAVLLTGRPLEGVRREGLVVARQQTLAYIAGGLGTALSSQLRQTLGLSEVRIEPVLIAGEANPNARLTVGQNLMSNLKLIYSMDVADANDQIWIADYQATRRFSSRITKQSDNTYRFDLNNDWRFGGMPLARTGTRHQRQVGEIRFTDGDASLSSEELLDRLNVEPGDTYDFFRVQRGMQRIERIYRERGMLEARLRLDAQRRDSIVDLNIHVRPGAKVTFAFEGWNPPGRVTDEVTNLWQEGVFDTQRLDDGVGAIRTELVRQGYLLAAINTDVNRPVPSEKQVVFDIALGPQFNDVQVIFPGAMAIEPDELMEVLKRADLRQRILSDPTRVKSLIETYYFDRGYLSATVSRPETRIEPGMSAGAIAVPIEEGPLYHVRSISFDGNREYTDKGLLAIAEVMPGAVFTPGLVNAAVTRLQELYWNGGYNDMSVEYDINVEEETGLVDVNFRVSEGMQEILSEVIVTGRKHTSYNLIRSQIPIDEGRPVGSGLLAQARSNLYATGAYQLIEVTRTPLPRDAGLAPHQVRVNLNVQVHEVQPYRERLGVYFDTERGPGFVSDFSVTSKLGSARVLGLRTRYDSELQDARVYFSQPALRRLPMRTTAEMFYTRVVHPSFFDAHVGFSLGQEMRFRDNYVLTYSYLIERTRITNRTAFPLSESTLQDPDETGGPVRFRFGGVIDGQSIPPFGFLTVRLAPLTTTLSRDVRDDLLDATKGSFTSHGLSFGMGFLGSQRHYVKYYGQYFRYIALGKPVPVPFKENVLRPRFIYAGAVRVGLATGLSGQELVQSERFFAGGGTSIRGFGQDEVGPKNPAGVPIGGNGLFILNNEVRFPLWSFIDGVGFIDLGNVYPDVSSYNPFSIRASVGSGLRARTPWILIRADYGLKIDRRPGESRGAFFVSIGQAF
jgi:outer membrane protein assembly complex protein YaeT